MSPRLLAAGQYMPYAAVTRRYTVAAVMVMRPEVSSNPPLHGTIVCNPPGSFGGSTGRIDATSKASRSITFDEAEGDAWVVWAETAIELASADSAAAEINP